MRYFFDKKVFIYKLVQGTGKSSYQEDSSGSVMGFLRPLDEQESSLNGIEQFGTGYRLMTDKNSGISATDKVKIDDILYLVKGRKEVRQGSIAYDSFLLTLPKKE